MVGGAEGASAGEAAGPASGGSLNLYAGASTGRDAVVGGAVNIVGGNTTTNTGGSVYLWSGHSDKTSSGDIHIRTVNAGSRGRSGSIYLKTGTSSSGQAGEFLSSRCSRHEPAPLRQALICTDTAMRCWLAVAPGSSTDPRLLRHSVLT